MTTKLLTPGKDTLTGTSKDDTFIAGIYDATTGKLAAVDPNADPYRYVPGLESSITKGDTIDGGAGNDTLIVNSAPNDGYNEATGNDGDDPLNQDLSLLHTKSVEKLVLVGDLTNPDAYDNPLSAAGTAIDLSHFAGLKEVEFTLPESAGQPDLFGGENDTAAVLNNITDQSITVDGTGDKIGLFPALGLNYAKGEKTADISYSNDAIGDVGLQVGGTDLKTINLTLGGKTPLDIVELFDAPGGSATVSTVNIETVGTGRALVAGGAFIDLEHLLGATGADDSLFHSPLDSAKTITVSGSGDALVDLSRNTQNVTFTGGKGDDAVLVSLANLNGKDHLDGGKGTDVFGIDMISAPKSAKTLTLTDAQYATVNAVDKDFEVFAILGDFKRQEVLDASKIDLSHILVAQDASVSQISDSTTIDFQKVGINGFDVSDLTLTHAANSKGELTGTGTINITGGDPLGAGPFLLDLATFGHGDGETLQGTAVLTSSSHYAVLNLSGSFDLEVKSASTWLDSKGVAHGITVDGSKNGGTIDVVGTKLADHIIGGAGDDTIAGGLGDDTMVGGGGSDTVSYADATAGVTIDLSVTSAQKTADGKDTISGFENILGSAHDDVLTGTKHANLLTGGAGNDHLDGGASSDTLDGGAGNDTLIGGTGSDTASYADAGKGVTVSLAITGAQDTGGAGKDVLSSIANLIGSAHNDVLTGDKNDNTLYGGSAGADQLHGGAGNDILYWNGADPTDENINTGVYAHPVVFDGGSGNDTLYLDSPDDHSGRGVGAYLPEFTLVSIERVVGSDYDDSVRGGHVATLIEGGGGNDSLQSMGANDTLDGGAGDDTLIGYDYVGAVVTVSYASATSAVTVNMGGYQDGSASGGGGHDVLQQISNLIGSSYSDTIVGDSDGTDLNNRIDGGLGNDTLTGGAGADTFVFDTKLGTKNIDTITDFTDADGDRIELSHSVFKGLSVGALDPSAFHMGSAADHAAERIVYDPSNGFLWFDADGSGKGDAIHFATLAAHLTLSAGDFTVA